MKKIIKFSTTLLVVMLLSFVLVACGGGEDNDPNVKVVRIWVHKSQAEDEGKVYKAIEEMFNAEKFMTSDDKEIRMRVEFKNSPDALQTAINAEVLAGGLPDIVALDSPNVSAYVDAGILTSITEYISEEVISDYVDSAVEQGTIDNDLYALFAMDAPVGLYYNKEVLEKAGITPGSIENPWSWKDLFNAVDILNEKDLPYKLKTNLGFGGDEGAMYLYSSLVYSAGGEFAGADGKLSGYLDSDASLAGLSIIEQFFSGTTKTPDLMYDGVNLDALASEEVAFDLYGPWSVDSIRKNYPDFENKYDIMPVPVYEDENGVKGEITSGSGSWGFGVTTSSNHVEAAAKALEYFTNAEASELLFDTIGTFPTHKSTLETSKAFQTGPLKSFSDILIQTSKARPKLVRYPELSLAYSKIFDYVEATYDTPAYNLREFVRTQIYQMES